MLFGFGDPEEIQAAMDRSEMQKDEFHHTLEGIWLSLTDDQLLTLSSYFHSICHSNDGMLHLSMVAGRLLQRRAERMKVCALDGKDHEAELKEMSGQAEKPEKPVAKKPIKERIIDEEAPLADWVEPVQEGGDPRVLKAVETAGNMVKYHLEYKGNDLNCSLCGYWYPSLEDRMMKSPEDCPGCHHKAKFG